MNVYAITLCFNNPAVVAASLDRFYQTRNPDLILKQHLLIDQHYPLPSKDETRRAVQAVADRHGCRVLRPERNLGLHDGWNWACSHLDLQDDDILIGYDPDSWPLTPGWDMALVTALSKDRRAGWASLTNVRSRRELEQKSCFEERVTDGYLRVWSTRLPVVNSVCAWKWGFLRKCGGLWEPKAYYGHLETWLFDRLKEQALDWVFLVDWTEDDTLRGRTDLEYIRWKWAHSHLGTWPGDFESFLAAGCPMPEEKTENP